MAVLQRGECVRLADGRPGRVRGKSGAKYRVRVRRPGSKGDEVLLLSGGELERIDPPAGWMSPEGYNRRVAAVRRAAAKRGVSRAR
ncbi:MAG: hypothetical protein M3167_13040 [Acidobacteriota bacterium]|nr:hypothetical protein [Acidobacteriota bacterium]